MITISAVIIVKNREKTIERCLKSIVDCDEIVILDTGSTDGTGEICRRYTDKYIANEYIWNDNFAEARNNAASYATKDWIFVIDSDEWLEDGGIKKIKEYLETIGEKLTAQVVANNSIMEYLTPRLYKNNSSIHYAKEFPVHEMFTFVDSDSVVDTIIYSEPKILDIDNPDPDRNLRILEGAMELYVEQPRNMYYLGKEYASPKRGRYKEAINVLMKYIQRSTFLRELEDAYLILAYCYDQLGDKLRARVFAGHAVASNPNNSQAILFMADLCDEKYRDRWLSFAEGATDEDTIIRLIK